MSDCGKRAIMVGYAKNSTGDTYRIYNPKINKITNTKGIIWTNRLFETEIRAEKGQSDYYTASEKDESYSESNKEEIDESYEPRRSSRIKSKDETDERVMRALRKLKVSYNQVMSGMSLTDDRAMVGGTDESYENLNIAAKKHGTTLLKKIDRVVWRQTKTSIIPKDRRLIGSKWVFKKKRNGVF